MEGHTAEGCGRGPQASSTLRNGPVVERAGQRLAVLREIVA
jgi:hypothetical protein